MRCLVVADLHYSLPQFDWLLSAAPHFDLVIFAGDALDVGSLVDFRAQIVVVRKYLTLLSGITRVILCSGNHDLDERSPEGEKISRWIGEVRELGVACDGDSLTIGDTLFTVCPWWDGPLVKARIDSQLRGAAAVRLKRWIWAHHALLRRRRARAMDRELPAFDGDLGPRASIAVHPGRFVVRPARRHLGIQYRAAARPPTGLYRARYR
jgi:predicted MPP superfamily phosphohydrolase